MLIADAPPTLRALETVFANAVKYLLVIGGILVFITFVMGGFKYLTSGGDPKAVASAHQTLTYAVLGLIMVILSFTFLLLIQYITGNTSLTNFAIFQQ